MRLRHHANGTWNGDLPVTPAEALGKSLDRDCYPDDIIKRLRALGFAIVPVEATAAMLMVDVQPSALILGSPHTPRLQHWRRAPVYVWPQ